MEVELGIRRRKKDMVVTPELGGGGSQGFDLLFISHGYGEMTPKEGIC